MMPPTKRWLWQSARDTVMLGAMYAVKFSGACVGVVFLSCTTVRLVLALWRGDIR